MYQSDVKEGYAYPTRTGTAMHEVLEVSDDLFSMVTYRCVEGWHKGETKQVNLKHFARSHDKSPDQEYDAAEYKHLIETGMYIAMVVRNEMEDFHCEHLTDKQMAELNPIIREGIISALVLKELAFNGNRDAQVRVGFMMKSVPSYWERPDIQESLTRLKRGRELNDCQFSESKDGTQDSRG